MKVAVLGLGFMGSTHARAWAGIPGVELAAVMSSDQRKLSGDLSAVQGNLGGPGERMDFANVRKYGSVEAVLADAEIDVIDICLPTDAHARVAIAAMDAGKYVLLEKPLALNEADAAEVLAAASRSGRIFMVAQVLRFIPQYEYIAEVLPRLGSVATAVFRRRCAAPAWSRWLSDPDKSGGGVFDLLIHDVDFCISVWGVPHRVRATGAENLAQGIDVMHAELWYDGFDGPVLITGGWHHAGAYPFSMEFTVTAESATLEWKSGGELTHYDSNEAKVIPVSDRDSFQAELAYFAECCALDRPPERCPPIQSAQSVAVMRALLDSRKRQGETISCR